MSDILSQLMQLCNICDYKVIDLNCAEMRNSMKNSSDNKGKKVLLYLFPGLITILVMLIVLAAKGI